MSARSISAPLVIAVALLSATSATAQPPPRDALARNTYIESAVHMAAFMSTVLADKNWGDCFLEGYFGSAFHPRDMVDLVWPLDDKNGANALLRGLLGICKAKPEERRKTNAASWQVPQPKGVTAPAASDARTAWEASLHTAAVVAKASGAAELAGCIEGLYARPAVMDEIRDYARQNPGPTHYHVVYGFLRQRCEGLKGKPDTKSIAFSESSYTGRAAAERIAAVADRIKCENRPDKKLPQQECISLLDKKRAVEIATELALDEATRKEEDARRKLEDIQRRAWRLPDGRLIFQSSKDSYWYFEDGTRVPPELATKRQPPR